MTKTPTIANRVEALEALLTQKGIVTSEQLDSIVARYADQVGPLNGARLIARAWTDPEFKARLLDDATSIVHEWKLEGGQVDRLIVKENTPSIHNVVVCTLCSCYPWAILGPQDCPGVTRAKCAHHDVMDAWGVLFHDQAVHLPTLEFPLMHDGSGIV